MPLLKGPRFPPYPRIQNSELSLRSLGYRLSSEFFSLEVLLAVAEDVRRQIDVRRFELLDELGPYAGRLHAADDLAAFDAGLLEDEYVLHDDYVALHTLDLGDAGDFAGAVLEALLL